MRALPKIAGFLMVLLTGAAETARADCTVTDRFYENVRAGKTPKAEMLDIRCLVDKDIRMAKGVASFLQERSIDSDSVAVVERVQDVYKTDNNRFRVVADQIQDELAGGTLGFEIASGKGKLLLDPLLEKLRSRIPVSVQDLKERFDPLEGRVRKLETSLLAPQPRTEAMKEVDKIKQGFWALAVFVLINFACVAFLLLSKSLFPKAEQAGDSVSNPQATPETWETDKPKAVDNLSDQKVELAPIPWKPEVDQLKEKFQKLEGDMGIFATLPERLTGIEERIRQAEPSHPPADLTPVYTQIRNMRSELQNLQASVADKTNTRDSSSELPIDLEREVLGEAWKKLCENKEVRAALNAPRLKAWEEIRNPLLVELPQIVPEDIKQTFDMILGPARDFDNMVTKISLVRRLVKKELPPLPVDAQELMRLRELTSLLTMIQNSNAVADRLNFQLEQWVCDQFVSFADLFLQRYQQAQLDGGQSVQAKLEPGLQIVRQVLKIADLEPVDLTPGQTPFDSNRHIGRSTASNSSFANGVIVGVVRNGFVRGGREVIRQPEVIVNRLA